MRTIISGKTRVAEVGNWDYEWSLFAVFVDEAGRLFSTTDSGCSCSSPYDYPEQLDWTPIDNIQAAIKSAREWSGASSKDIEDFVSDLMGYSIERHRKQQRLMEIDYTPFSAACRDPFAVDYGQIVLCRRQTGHDGDHATRAGAKLLQWACN